METRSPYQTLLDYAFRLLGIKAYSEVQLRQRLTRKAKRAKITDYEDALKKVMERLHELNYINDERILADYFEYRLKARPQGRFGFLQAMHQRGISIDCAKEAWDKRGVNEKEMALQLLKDRQHKFAGLPIVLKKKKIAALLGGKGFSPETVWGVLDGVK